MKYVQNSLEQAIIISVHSFESERVEVAQLRKALQAVRFKEMENKTFVAVQVIEKLCEFCGKPLTKEEREIRSIQISNHDDYGNLLIKARAHDRVEVDLEKNRIYLYDHDYPGDVHPSCVEKYSEKS